MSDEQPADPLSVVERWIAAINDHAVDAVTATQQAEEALDRAWPDRQ
jgi:hypothetical protein